MKLSEIIKKANGSLDVRYITGKPFEPTSGVPALIQFLINGLASLGTLTASDFPEEMSGETANSLWCKYIVPTFKDCEYCVEVENDETKTVQKFCEGFMALFNMTAMSFITKIESFEDLKNSLTGQLITRTESFNQDTPQNVLDGGWDDAHVSSRNKSQVETDAGTPAARIAEINLNITNTFEEWVEYFKGLFLMGD